MEQLLSNAISLDDILESIVVSAEFTSAPDFDDFDSMDSDPEKEPER